MTRHPVARALVLAAALLPGVAAFSLQGMAAEPAGPAKGPLTIAGYTVQQKTVRGKPGRQELRIVRDGRVLARVTAERVGIYGGDQAGADPDDLRNVMPRPGDDFAGVDEQGLIVETGSGGAHCCTELHLFVLGDQRLRRLGTVRGGSYPILFRQLDEATDLEIVVRDGSFAHGMASVAEPVAPQVVLKFDPGSGQYRFSADLMRRSAPTEADLEARAERVRAHELWADGDGIPPALWAEMLSLVYAGQGEAARRLLEQAWPRDAAARDRFAYELMDCRLRLSPYWPDLAALNNWRAEPPAADCPRP